MREIIIRILFGEEDRRLIFISLASKVDYYKKYYKDDEQTDYSKEELNWIILKMSKLVVLFGKTI